MMGKYLSNGELFPAVMLGPDDPSGGGTGGGADPPAGAGGEGADPPAPPDPGQTDPGTISISEFEKLKADHQRLLLVESPQLFPDHV